MADQPTHRIVAPGRTSMRNPPRAAVSIDLEVPFADVDALQIVWHGHYLRYLDLARTALLRARGLDVPQIAAVGYQMVVVQCHVRYIYPLRYADRFRVSAWITETWNRVSVAYLVRNLTHERRAARAQTVLVTTDRQGNVLWQTPTEIREKLKGGEHTVAQN